MECPQAVRAQRWILPQTINELSNTGRESQLLNSAGLEYVDIKDIN